MKKFCSILLAFLCNHLITVGQISNETIPVSWNIAVNQNEIVWKSLSFIDPSGLLAEDALVSKSEPMRFAKNRIVNYTPASEGRWINLANGDRIWKLGIKCTGGFSVGLLFSEFNIPVGARVYIYSQDQSQHLGPFTKADNRGENEILVTPPIYGEKLIVEYYEPFAYRGQGDFNIKSVQHGYRDLKNMEYIGSCFNILQSNSINRGTSASIMMMVVDGGQKIATGTLVNNTSGSSRPYVITSLNALKGNPEGWVFLFDVTKKECLERNNCWSTAVCGASPVSADSINGTALVSLKTVPPGSWAVYYSGWNAGNNSGNGTYQSIQHADGLVQSVANYTGQLQSVVWNGYNTKRITNWTTGGTSSASIGSPLLDSSGNLVGIYLGGDLSCGGSGADYFATFSSSFDLYNAYLDPVRSGASILNGVYPVRIQQEPDESEWKVDFFPNPAKDWIYIETNTDNLLVSEIHLYDLQGRLINKILPQTPTILLGNLPEGLYTIHFISGNNKLIKKLLIR